MVYSGRTVLAGIISDITAMKRHTISKAEIAQRYIKNYHFWIIAFLFILIAFSYYIDLLPGISSFFLVWSGGHSFYSILLLVPIIYTAFMFGFHAGALSLLLALFVLLPHAIFFSATRFTALMEVISVLIVGCLIIYWSYVYVKNMSERKGVEEMLNRIIDSSAMPAFVINKQHKVTHWNTALEMLTGIKRQDVTGTSNQWKAFFRSKRPVMADYLIDGASEETILERYGKSFWKNPLIEGAYEAEFFFPALGESGKWLYFTANTIEGNDGEVVSVIETLYDITERKNAEANTRYYLKEITRAQEDERKRIARELHDETAQNLIALLHQLENFLNEIKNIPPHQVNILWNFHYQIKDVLQQVRHFSRDLRPSLLDDLGFLPALEWIISELKTSYSIDIVLKVEGEARRLSADAELSLFRIVQEALRNVVKHANATRAEVEVRFEDTRIVVIVNDNGSGFTPPQNLRSLPQTGKLGLTGLQERVQLLGGFLELESKKGKGTTLYIETPGNPFVEVERDWLL